MPKKPIPHEPAVLTNRDARFLFVVATVLGQFAASVSIADQIDAKHPTPKELRDRFVAKLKTAAELIGIDRPRVLTKAIDVYAGDVYAGDGGTLLLASRAMDIVNGIEPHG